MDCGKCSECLLSLSFYHPIHKVFLSAVAMRLLRIYLCDEPCMGVELQGGLMFLRASSRLKQSIRIWFSTMEASKVIYFTQLEGQKVYFSKVAAFSRMKCEYFVNSCYKDFWRCRGGGARWTNLYALEIKKIELERNIFAAFLKSGYFRKKLTRWSIMQASIR